AGTSDAITRIVGSASSFGASEVGASGLEDRRADHCLDLNQLADSELSFDRLMRPPCRPCKPVAKMKERRFQFPRGASFPCRLRLGESYCSCPLPHAVFYRVPLYSLLCWRLSRGVTSQFGEAQSPENLRSS
ncbi:unnamed protein product, partial [Symbiodinium microadriaticum]